MGLTTEEVGQRLDAWLASPSDDNYSALVNAARARLQDVASHILPHDDRMRNFLSSDDLFQEFSIELWNDMKREPPRSAKDFWLTSSKLIRWKLMSLVRHYTREVRGGGRVPVELDPGAMELPQPEDSTSGLAMWSEAWQEFLEEAEKLEELDRNIFDCLWTHGLSRQQAALELGLSRRKLSERWIVISVRLGRQLRKLV